MATAVNPSTSAGISIGSAVGFVAEWLRQCTVRVNGSRGAHGSGVIWKPEGLIVTNSHVADDRSHEVKLWDGRTLQGWVVARNRRLDLVALAVDANGLPAAAVRSARSMRPGEMVIAVGNPWDGERAVSTGIVHRVSQSPWLIADIRLAPGNSGGPLSDAEGNVVGINSMVVAGLGCAVTSDAVSHFLWKEQLAKKD